MNDITRQLAALRAEQSPIRDHIAVEGSSPGAQLGLDDYFFEELLLLGLVAAGAPSA